MCDMCELLCPFRIPCRLLSTTLSLTVPLLFLEKAGADAAREMLYFPLTLKWQ